MNLFNKTSWKFLGIFIAIVAGSAAIAYMAVFFSPEARQERAMADLLEQYANDTYGGETPEETLSLFIKALEAGDVELASKYAILDNQQHLLEELKISKKNGFLDEYIDILTDSTKRKSYNKDLNYYEFRSEYKGENIFVAKLILNTQTNKWKISEL